MILQITQSTAILLYYQLKSNQFKHNIFDGDECR